MEEKYKKHAIYQTQFENDNQKLLYEVDLLKDLIEEHEELIIELRRQFKDKSRVRTISFLNFLNQFKLICFKNKRNWIIKSEQIKICKQILFV